MAELGLYGIPPKDLAPIAAGAVQFSPLVVGSQRLEEVAPNSLASFTILVPPGTLERRYALALALRSLAPGAPLTALGPKDKGGARIAKELREWGLEVEEDSRRHHRICVAKKGEAIGAFEEAIAAGAPRLDPKLNLYTQPGVFSWDRLDPGSLLLLDCLPAFTGRGADLGCGLGVLARAVLEKSAGVRALHLVDLDRRALDCARKNVPDPRAQFSWADLRHADPGLTELDFVVSNPPFHEAGAEDQGLGQRFLAQTAHMLRAGGKLWVVANRHLPYEAHLRAAFSEVRLAAETSAFKVYEAHR